MNELSQLAVDIYQNKVSAQFDKNDAENTLRQELITLFGTDKIDQKTIRKAPVEFAEIIEESLDALVSRSMEEEFSRFAEIRNVAYGDQVSFEVENPDLFEVAEISEGNANLSRQRIYNDTITVEPVSRGVKIYDELARFLAGRVDWAALVEKVSRSYMNKIYSVVYDSIYNNFSNLDATYQESGSFSESTLRNLISHVEAEAGREATLWGTKNALSQVSPSIISESAKEQINQQGYVRVFEGTIAYEIKQVHKPKTDNFAINDNFLLVLPQGEEKIVKIVDEGESYVDEVTGMNAAMQIEYMFIKKSGCKVIVPNKYGMFKLA